MAARLPATLVANLDPTHFNRSLTSAELAEIRDCAKGIEKQYFYSTLAAPLALCRDVRNVQKKPPGPDCFRTALETFSPTAKHLLHAYRGATCFSLAQELRDALNETLEVRALVVAEDEPLNVISHWPSPHGDNQPHRAAFDHMSGVTHVDLIVPTAAQNKDQCLVHLPCGQGPDSIPDNLCKLSLQAFRGSIAASSYSLEALAVPTYWKPAMLSRDKNIIFGMDLLRGHLYVDRASAAYATNVTEANNSLLSYSFKSLDFSADQMALMVEAVRHAFSLPRDFSQDVFFLIDNYESYLEGVLLPRAKTLSYCVDRMTTSRVLQAYLSPLVAAIPQPEATPTAALLARAQQMSREAACCVDIEEGQKASDLYERSLDLLTECRDLVVEHLVFLAHTEPRKLLMLDRDALAGLPDAMLRGIIQADENDKKQRERKRETGFKIRRFEKRFPQVSKNNSQKQK
ncbi:MAG: hypothetical protein EOO40_01995 [Deltaproteobacteria bacterium]|nr:MAG: hypothetical protein EOO40_01995 [Deltaproteobacteria bacterium]